MKWWALGGLVGLLAVAMTVQAIREAGTETAAAESLHPVYGSGQRWRVKARPLEEGATVTILELHRDAKHGLLVHVRVDGVRLETTDGILDNIAHMPLSLKAFEASIIRLYRTGQPLGEYYYKMHDWIRGYEAGRWPCIETSVEDGIAKTELSMRLAAGGSRG